MCCVAEAGMVPLKSETQRVDYCDRIIDLDALSGYRCPACGEIEFDVASFVARYADAGDGLVLAERRGAQ